MPFQSYSFDFVIKFQSSLLLQVIVSSTCAANLWCELFHSVPFYSLNSRILLKKSQTMDGIILSLAGESHAGDLFSKRIKTIDRETINSL